MESSLTLIDSILLGFVQGLTEFLPVSSSGHLVLSRHLFSMPEVPLLFDVTLHVATLLVVISFYRVQVLSILKALLHVLQRRVRPEDPAYLRLTLNLVISTIATVLLALIIRAFLPEGESVVQVSLLMFFTAAILLYRPKKERSGTVGDMKISSALIVGIAQGFGTLAGISRSGITITSSHATGLSRTEAGTYSFLLSIPAILGALVLTLADASGTGASVAPAVLAGGTVSAFITGFFSLKMLLWVIEKAKLWYFSIYLVCAATGMLILAL